VGVSWTGRRGTSLSHVEGGLGLKGGCKCVTVVMLIWWDHLAWPLVVGALLVIAKRGAQPQTLAKLLGANCAGPMGNP
jgi:hypothetical protein